MEVGKAQATSCGCCCLGTLHLAGIGSWAWLIWWRLLPPFPRVHWKGQSKPPGEHVAVECGTHVAFVPLSFAGHPHSITALSLKILAGTCDCTLATTAGLSEALSPPTVTTMLLSESS